MCVLGWTSVDGSMAPVATRSALRFVSRATPCRVTAISLRRPELAVRRTDYVSAIVDERVLTRAFPWLGESQRRIALAVLRGRIEWDAVRARPGDVVLLRLEDMARGRFVDTTFLELEWKPEQDVPLREPVLVRGGVTGLDELAAVLDDDLADVRETLRRAFETFAAAGIAHGLAVDELAQGPSEDDVAFVRALDAQFATLATAADTDRFGEALGLSPRQVQRRFADYACRMHVGSVSWRDLRNRWRVQLAVVLLGNARVRVEDVAREVGYASGPALARALAAHGLPNAREIRRRFREADGSESDIGA